MKAGSERHRITGGSRRLMRTLSIRGASAGGGTTCASIRGNGMKYKQAIALCSRIERRLSWHVDFVRVLRMQRCIVYESRTTIPTSNANRSKHVSITGSLSIDGRSGQSCYCNSLRAMWALGMHPNGRTNNTRWPPEERSHPRKQRERRELDIMMPSHHRNSFHKKYHTNQPFGQKYAICSDCWSVRHARSHSSNRSRHAAVSRGQEGKREGM
jgi:hypothetical protein